MTVGYDQPLYVLPFDHRGTFQKNMFGWTGALTPSHPAEIAAAKQVIYDGFKAALAAGVPKEKAGILVDEQFGRGHPPRAPRSTATRPPARPRRAGRTSSTSSTGTTSPSTSRRFNRVSARYWFGTTRRVTWRSTGGRVSGSSRPPST